MRDKRRKSTTPGSEPAPAPTEAGELPERWSVQRKSELVLRLLRGEALDAVSRESQVPAMSSRAGSGSFLSKGPRAQDPERSRGARAHTRSRQDRGTDDALGARRVSHRKKGAHGRVEEAAAMRRAVSSATGRRYPLTMTCAVFRVARSTVYRTTAPASSATPIAAKRGPKTRWSDAEVVAAIRLVLMASPFHGEGYRKIRARLAHRGLAIGGK